MQFILISIDHHTPSVLTKELYINDIALAIDPFLHRPGAHLGPTRPGAHPGPTRASPGMHPGPPKAHPGPRNKVGPENSVGAAYQHTYIKIYICCLLPIAYCLSLLAIFYREHALMLQRPQGQASAENVQPHPGLKPGTRRAQ